VLAGCCGGFQLRMPLDQSFQNQVQVLQKCKSRRIYSVRTMPQGEAGMTTR
jgi:hypothetical protein